MSAVPDIYEVSLIYEVGLMSAEVYLISTWHSWLLIMWEHSFLIIPDYVGAQLPDYP
jgi:hypothetical protein